MDEIYAATVKIRAGRKKYQPGEVVDSSLPDMDYLIDSGFVKPVCKLGKKVDAAPPVSNGDAEKMPLEPNPDTAEPSPMPDLTNTPDDLDDDENSGTDVPEFYTEEQLKKLKSKAAIAEYAESIGLPGLDTNLHKTELIDKVLAYIAGVMNDEV